MELLTLISWVCHKPPLTMRWVMERFLATAINWPQINDSSVINDAALSFLPFSPGVSLRSSVCRRCLSSAGRRPSQPWGFSVYLLLLGQPRPVMCKKTVPNKATVTLAGGLDQLPPPSHFPCLSHRKSLFPPPCPHLCNLTQLNRAPTNPPSGHFTVTSDNPSSHS